jgi:CBS-domain-containing membrane protein
MDIFDLKDTTDELFDQLPDYFIKWSKAIAEAEPIFKMEGKTLLAVLREVSYHQYQYGLKCSDADMVADWLTVLKQKSEARYLKNYQQHNPRALSISESRALLAGEKEVVELSQLIVQVQKYKRELKEIRDAILQMNYVLTNLTRLKVAEMEDYIL